MSKNDRAPRHSPEITKGEHKGLILVFTGDGKGKSTAAFGIALRTLGQGGRVAMVQFLKGKWKTGEREALKNFGNRFEVYSMGEGFTWETKDFENDVKTAQKAWAKCREILHGMDYGLVIFDEINYAIQYNFLKSEEVLEELKKRPAKKHVILTGNGAPAELIQAADLVTEMKNIKHPYQEGFGAQPGIDY